GPAVEALDAALAAQLLVDLLVRGEDHQQPAVALAQAVEDHVQRVLAEPLAQAHDGGPDQRAEHAHQLAARDPAAADARPDAGPRQLLRAARLARGLQPRRVQQRAGVDEDRGGDALVAQRRLEGPVAARAEAAEDVAAVEAARVERVQRGV